MSRISDSVIQERAAAYDREYANWHAKRVTCESYEHWSRFVLDAPGAESGNINGNEYGFAMRLLNVEQLRGKRVLDYCCGTGLSAIYFGLKGASVSAFDRSLRAIQRAQESACLSGAAGQVQFGVMDAQYMAYPSGSFDLVYCQSALHIIIDYPRCAAELARVLRPGGRVVFSDEALGHNPLMMPFRWWRRRRWKSHGGRALSCADLCEFGRCFAAINVYHFNLLSQIKALLEPWMCRPLVKRVLRLLYRLDLFLLKHCSLLRRFSGKVVVELVAPGHPVS